MAVTIHQRDDVDRDVISGAQLVVTDPPASVPQDASGSHDQVLGRHGVPVYQQQQTSVGLKVTCLSAATDKCWAQSDTLLLMHHGKQQNIAQVPSESSIPIGRYMPVVVADVQKHESV